MALNIEQPDALIAYLRARGRLDPGENPSIRVLSGGVSNRTVLVERTTGDRWVIKQALEQLRVAAEWRCSPERVHREALGLRWLEQLAPLGGVARWLFEDSAEHLFAMEAVPEPHDNWKQLLLAGQAITPQVDRFADWLATVHLAAFAKRAVLAVELADRSFFEALRLEPYYAYAAAQVPAAGAFIEQLSRETRATQITLVHGDYSPKNVLLHQDRLIVLDHEVIHWGDPAFDLGFSLAHFLAKALHVRHRRADFIAAAARYWSQYRSQAGPVAESPGLESRSVRHALACLLARVVGRSPLEYLRPEERLVQRNAACILMRHPPLAVHALADRFYNLIQE